MQKIPLFVMLAARQLRRDFSAGELRLLAMAVVLAVAALTAVGFFADRINAGLTRDAQQLLGGDAVLASDQPVPAAFEARAQSLGLLRSTTAGFVSMGRAAQAQGGASRLVSVKAVSDTYPLRGVVKLDAEANPADAKTALIERHGAPERGTVWVDAPLLTALQLQIGDTLLLGDANLRIAHTIVAEPDRGVGFAGFAPRVMLHEADLSSTGLVQPASRVTYRFAVVGRVGNESAVREFTEWAQLQIKQLNLRGLRVESLETGRPEMRQTLDRATQFLNLVALLSALLAAVAVGIASRDFANRHLDDCAMLRVLGLSQRTIAAQYALEFCAVGLLASAVGVLLGFVTHHVFIFLLAGLVTAELPAASVWPALFGLAVGLTLLVGFGLPPVLQLARVPPLRVMRRDVGAPKAASLSVLLAGAVGFSTLLLFVARDPKLGLIAVGGFAAALALFAAAAWGAVALLKRAVPHMSTAPRWLVLATRQVAARPAFAVLQVSALSVGLMALMLLVLLRTDLIQSWRQATPKDAPNRFVINIQPDQSRAFRERLQDAGVKGYDWFPMIRGRLVAINNKPVVLDAYPNERAQRLLDREFNLSHDAKMPPHNRVEAGRWTPNEPNAVSVEAGLAQTLGLKLGDLLSFDVGGATAQGRITSLRKVDWGSMRVNFFVMFPVENLNELPRSYIAAYQTPPQTPPQKSLDNLLTREFPNITSIDVSASVAQVQQVLSQVVKAVEFLFVFTLTAGLVVLFSAITATREARAREFAVMRALGASTQLLMKVQQVELLGVGGLAGVLASLAAMAVGWALAHYVFEFSWGAPWWLPLLGGLAGAFLAFSAGWWGLRSVLQRPVMHMLRTASD
jgi:putative ABC transport system permease protein